MQAVTLTFMALLGAGVAQSKSSQLTLSVEGDDKHCPQIAPPQKPRRSRNNPLKIGQN